MDILHSKIIGQGAPLLILHGFLGMSDNWKTLGNRFASDFEVHLIDQRNHGRSFHANDFIILFLREIKIEAALGLEDFTLADI